MAMMREYIRNGKDIFKEASKLEKQIEKFKGYLTKERKTPAKPEKIKEWKDKLIEAENKLAIMDIGTQVEFDGVSLDKICRKLGLELEHHNAQSDAKVLIDIHKFVQLGL